MGNWNSWSTVNFESADLTGDVVREFIGRGRLGGDCGAGVLVAPVGIVARFLRFCTRGRWGRLRDWAVARRRGGLFGGGNVGGGFVSRGTDRVGVVTGSEKGDAASGCKAEREASEDRHDNVR